MKPLPQLAWDYIFPICFEYQLVRNEELKLSRYSRAWLQYQKDDGQKLRGLLIGT